MPGFLRPFHDNPLVFILMLKIRIAAGPIAGQAVFRGRQAAIPW